MPQIACDRCTQGVMDSTNPHLDETCGCSCHTDTPLLDYLTELGPAGRDLLNACRDVVAQADRELGILARRVRRERIDRRVVDFFAENPGASANEAWREIGGNKADVLDSVRAVRSGTTGAVPA